jgi:hypothetical protein
VRTGSQRTDRDLRQALERQRLGVGDARRRHRRLQRVGDRCEVAVRETPERGRSAKRGPGLLFPARARKRERLAQPLVQPGGAGRSGRPQVVLGLRAERQERVLGGGARSQRPDARRCGGRVVRVGDRRLPGRQQRVLGDRDTPVHDHDVAI